MGGILAPVGVVILLACFVGMITDNDYGTIGHMIGWIVLICIAVGLAAYGIFLLVVPQVIDSEKQTDRSYDRVEPPETELDKNGNEVDTKWTRITESRTAWHDDHH